MNNTWYIIINPTSGGGKTKKKINKILKIISQYNLIIKTVNTQYPHHEEELVEKAIKLGYYNFICVGGDGTIHHMINGIMKQKHIDTSEIKLAVIPTGTGNDWVKNYNIPKDPKKFLSELDRYDLDGIIVLFLDKVGTGSGMDLEFLEELRGMSVHPMIFGGGIRGLEDLDRLKNIGMDGALVATAVHNGKIPLDLLS